MYTTKDLHSVLTMGDNDLNDEIGAYPMFSVAEGDDSRATFAAELVEAEENGDGATTHYRITIERVAGAPDHGVAVAAI